MGTVMTPILSGALTECIYEVAPLSCEALYLLSSYC